MKRRIFTPEHDAFREVVRTFAIVTTEANAPMRAVHDRMPVILAPEDWAVWLEADDPLALLRPAPDDLLRFWPVSKAVNSPRNNGPELLVAFATDSAAGDIREEKSNDPLSPLLALRLAPAEAARYRSLRERYPFKVFKDRKFVATPGLKAVAQAVCEAAGTRNILYDLRVG